MKLRYMGIVTPFVRQTRQSWAAAVYLRLCFPGSPVARFRHQYYGATIGPVNKVSVSRPICARQQCLDTILVLCMIVPAQTSQGATAQSPGPSFAKAIDATATIHYLLIAATAIFEYLTMCLQSTTLLSSFINHQAPLPWLMVLAHCCRCGEGCCRTPPFLRDAGKREALPTFQSVA